MLFHVITCFQFKLFIIHVKFNNKINVLMVLIRKPIIINKRISFSHKINPPKSMYDLQVIAHIFFHTKTNAESII